MKPRERADPKPTDLGERLIALRRRTASKTPRTTSTQQPAQSTPQSAVEPSNVEAEEFSRRLKISNSNPQPSSSKLFNPERDPVPTFRRTTEPEAMSDATSSNYVSRSQSRPTGSHHQLFDHRKDDPVRFSVLSRPGVSPSRKPPTPKSSSEWVSSSASSYAPSQASSTFTLSSTTDGSSASSALFDGRGNQKPTPSEEAGNNVFAAQLKKLYRAITTLENKIKQEDEEVEADRAAIPSSKILVKGKEGTSIVQTIGGDARSEEDTEKEKWESQIKDHKRLVDIMHNLLEISLAPSVPASLRNIPTKYNIIVRLWTYGFFKLLESLRRASRTSKIALEHLQDFIYYAYSFYTGLLEEHQLSSFKSGWLEALGDLARYKMAITSIVEIQRSPTALTLDNLSRQSGGSATPSESLAAPVAVEQPKSNHSVARIDDSPSPSVGLVAARAMELEPEKERWRSIARAWYGNGLADQPGTGKLHHHLGLLSRDVEGDELRAVYHYVKSLTTLHPFSTSRESILPVFSSAAQSRRALPDAKSIDLFLLMHGMLFTNIDLDDFPPALARFMERLTFEEDSIEEREWVMMGVINIASILEYGKSTGVIRKLGGGVGTTKVLAKKDTEEMEVDDGAVRTTPAISVSPAVDDTSSYPLSFTHALTLSFSLLSHVLKKPTRKASPFALKATVNPHLSVMLTFLTTVLKQPGVCSAIEKWIPWDDMRNFFSGNFGRGNQIPRGIWESQGLIPPSSGIRIMSKDEGWTMLTSSTAPPLPEDWCLRGMEWVGRKVYERGFFKSGEEHHIEVDYLNESEIGKGDDGTDGQIESDNDSDDVVMGDSTKPQASPGDVNSKRWIRVLRSAIGIATAVEGFNWVENSREFVVQGPLQQKAHQWKEEERLQRLEDERRRLGRRWTDDDEMEMEVDDDNHLQSESSDEDDLESEEVKALKARRKYLESLLEEQDRTPMSRRREPRQGSQPLLPILPGFTVLIVDTNILLSSLQPFSKIVESLQWTVIVPLPVVMELDGLSSNATLGSIAKDALSYIASHIRSHGASLKVQTSKGNYLSSLSVRAEEVDFSVTSSGRGDVDRNMDDLILKAAIWQEEHWIDRSALLQSRSPSISIADPVKVTLLSLDRNLRLKARSRQLPAASEKDIAAIFGGP